MTDADGGLRRIALPLAVMSLVLPISSFGGTHLALRLREFGHKTTALRSVVGGLIGGTVKSSIGIGNLLWAGIGDTIRVSLSAEPEEEVRVGFEILKALGIRDGPGEGEPEAFTSTEQAHSGKRSLALRWDKDKKAASFVSVDPPLPGEPVTR